MFNISKPTLQSEQRAFERSLRNPRERHRAVAKKAVGITAAMAFAIGAAGHVYTEYFSDRPPEEPIVHIFDKNIVWSNNDEKANPILIADNQPDNPSLVEQCKNSQFAVIYLSGTGFEGSHYYAGQYDETVRSLGGCSLYLWYGQHYDKDKNAQAVIDAVDKYSLPNETKDVILYGASFGGNAAEAIANNPKTRESKSLRVIGVAMESTPIDRENVQQKVFGVPVDSLLNIADNVPDIIKYNHLPILISNLSGQIETGHFNNWQDVKDLYINTAKTWPPLVWDEITEVNRGISDYAKEIPMAIIGASDGSDPTVNVTQAALSAKTKFDDVTEYLVPGGGHAGGWLGGMKNLYQPALESSLKMFLSKA